MSLPPDLKNYRDPAGWQPDGDAFVGFICLLLFAWWVLTI